MLELVSGAPTAMWGSAAPHGGSQPRGRTELGVVSELCTWGTVVPKVTSSLDLSR